MKHAISWSLCFAFLALAAMQGTARAQVLDGDFKSGFNTWKTAKAGQWVEYSVGGATIRYEVLAVDEAEIKARKTATLPAADPITRELSGMWSTLPLEARLPEGELTWETGNFKLGEIELACVVARFTKGGKPASRWFSAKVPCGGAVKTTSNGVDGLLLTGFGEKAPATAPAEDPAKLLEDVKLVYGRYHDLNFERVTKTTGRKDAELWAEALKAAKHGPYKSAAEFQARTDALAKSDVGFNADMLKALSVLSLAYLKRIDDFRKANPETDEGELLLTELRQSYEAFGRLLAEATGDLDEKRIAGFRSEAVRKALQGKYPDQDTFGAKLLEYSNRDAAFKERMQLLYAELESEIKRILEARAEAASPKAANPPDAESQKLLDDYRIVYTAFLQREAAALKAEREPDYDEIWLEILPLARHGKYETPEAFDQAIEAMRAKESQFALYLDALQDDLRRKHGYRKPIPRPLPDVSKPDYGDPLAMKLPEKVRKAIADQGNATTRLRVYFDKKRDGLALDYEGMHTVIPVIYAAFKGEQCDRVLSYPEWKRRKGRYVDLAFDVQTLPGDLKGFGVQIEHLHLRGEKATRIAVFEVSVPDAGDPWDALRLPGTRPGINQYRLIVSYRNAKGRVTTYTGFSHWVLVEAPPMFEFASEVTCEATRRQAGEITILAAEVSLRSRFLLHHGFRAEDCTVRLSRRGARKVDLSRLSPEVRRIVNSAKTARGWHEVVRARLDGKGANGLTIERAESSRLTITFSHALSATSDVLPLEESWEYRFELLHRGSNKPLATWTAHIELQVTAPAQIRSAKLRITATGLKKPLLVPFRKER